MATTRFDGWLTSVRALFALLTLATVSTAQCSLYFDSVGPAAGPTSASTMVEWDPDGPGPMPECLVVGSASQIAQSQIVRGVAVYDWVTGVWSGLGGGLQGVVNALAVLTNGDLVLGGYERVGATGSQPCVKRWNGSAWIDLGLPAAPGSGTTAVSVTALATTANGDLYATGNFALSGGSGGCIARWSNGVWSQVGTVVGSGEFLCADGAGGIVAGGMFSQGRVGRFDGTTWQWLATTFAPAYGSQTSRGVFLANGDLVIIGGFASVDGVAATNVARWNGSSWSAMGAGLPAVLGGPTAVDVLPDGSVLVGAGPLPLLLAGGQQSLLARWDGNTWSAYGGSAVAGVAGSFLDLLVTSAHGVVAGAGGPMPTMPVGAVFRWDGATWQGLGQGMDGSVHAIAVDPAGDLLAVGRFRSLGAVPGCDGLARWTGQQWSPVATLPPQVRPESLRILPNGSLLTIGSVPFQPFYLAEWDGTSWQDRMTGWIGLPSRSLALRDGTMVIGGAFTQAAGTAAHNIVTYDGTTWSPIGAGVPGFNVLPLLQSRDGDLWVADVQTISPNQAESRILRWNGVTWSKVGSPLPGRVDDLIECADGSFVVGGRFYVPFAGWRSMRLVAGDWKRMAETSGSGNERVRLHERPDGELVMVKADISSLSGASLLRWTAGGWVWFGSIPAGQVNVLRNLPGGDLLVGGSFTSVNGVTIRSLARWDGASWSEVAGGFGGVPSVSAGVGVAVRDIVTLPSGELAVSGGFEHAGSVASPGLVWLRSTCPAAMTAVGVGCSASGGAVQLRGVDLPSLGGRFQAVTTGAPAAVLGVAVWGLGSANVALASVLPQAGPGCMLLTAPVAIEIVLAAFGVVHTGLRLAATPALLGGSVHHQVLPVELDASGQLQTVTAANALVLTIGSY